MGHRREGAWQLSVTSRLPTAPPFLLAGIRPLAGIDRCAESPFSFNLSRQSRPTPTIADAEGQGHVNDNDTNDVKMESREAVHTPSATRAPTLGTHATPQEGPLTWDALITDTSARVRLDKHTCEPARHSISGVEQLNQWIFKNVGKTESPRETLRRGARIAPTRDAKLAPNGKKSPDTLSPSSSR